MDIIFLFICFIIFLFISILIIPQKGIIVLRSNLISEEVQGFLHSVYIIHLLNCFAFFFIHILNYVWVPISEYLKTNPFQ